MKGSGISIPNSEDGTVIDVIRKRGFVDGVKVARKCSKANILGKAVECNRVLKKRENRVKTEQAGLKTPVAGLVGGSALLKLKEWERDWRQRFCEEEKDEVERKTSTPGVENTCRCSLSSCLSSFWRGLF